VWAATITMTMSTTITLMVAWCTRRTPLPVPVPVVGANIAIIMMITKITGTIVAITGIIITPTASEAMMMLPAVVVVAARLWLVGTRSPSG
jgi:hypothetical protein